MRRDTPRTKAEEAARAASSAFRLDGALCVAPLLFWQTLVLAFATGIAAAVHPFPALLVFLLCLWLDSRARGVRAIVMLLSLVAGLFCGIATLPELAPKPPGWLENRAEVTARIASTRGLTDGRLRLVLDEVRQPGFPEADPLQKKVVWTLEKPDFYPLSGQTVTASLRIRPIRGFLNTDGNDIGNYWKLQNIYYSAYLSSQSDRPRLEGEGSLLARVRALWHLKLRNTLDAIDLPEAGKALIPALLFGDQSHIRSSDLEMVTKAGLRHSLALSGQHLTVVGILAILPIFLLKYIVPGLYLSVPRRLLAGLISLPLAIMCLWLGNAPSSLIRAAIMLAVVVIALWRARPHTLMDGLFAAFVCILVANPANLFDLGVQLSFGAVAGIALATPLLRQITRADPMHHSGLAFRGLIRFGLSALVITLAAQAAVLPLTLHVFGRATPGLVTNLLWLPVLGLVVLPASWIGMLLLAAGFDGLGSLCMHVAALPCSLLMRGLAWMEGEGLLASAWCLRPHWTSMLGFWALFLALMLLRGAPLRTTARRIAMVGAVLLLCGTGIRLYGSITQALTLRLLDVGQGQAILVEWPGGRGLVDAGGFASTRFDSGRDILAPILASNRPPALSFVSASHMDRDHVGGLLFLTEHFDVPLFFMSLTERLEGKPVFEQKHLKPDEIRLTTILADGGIPVSLLARGDTVHLTPDTWLETVWPPPGRILKGNDSLVLRLVHRGEGLALMTGDIEPREQRAMIDAAGPDGLRAKVLIIPHHGSKRNLEPALYDAVRPHVALASCGAANRWGFPAPEVRAALALRGIALYDTGACGEISATLGNDGIRLRSVTGNLQKP